MTPNQRVVRRLRRHGIEHSPGLWEILKPMKVYKSVLRVELLSVSRRTISLTIPVGAVVVWSENHWCKLRASHVWYDGDNSKRFISRWASNFIYNPQSMIFPKDEFNTDSDSCCGSGIHFFLTKDQADRW